MEGLSKLVTFHAATASTPSTNQKSQPKKYVEETKPTNSNSNENKNRKKEETTPKMEPNRDNKTKNWILNYVEQDFEVKWEISS